MFLVTHLLVLLLSTILTECGVSVHDPFYCYSDDPIRPQYAWFGPQTAYETVRGRNINANVSTCTPSKFWMYSRYGTRFPAPLELDDIWAMAGIKDEILSNYNRGRTSLCASDIDLIRNWEFDPTITYDIAMNATAGARDEFEALARRFQAAFPEILLRPYSRNDFLFHASRFQRTELSLQGFADGLFGANAHENIDFVHVEPDFFMRFFDHCPLYHQVVGDLSEWNAFIEGPEYQEMLVQVSAKLGFRGSNVLRNSDVRTLLIICRYEQVWNPNELSPLCSAFSVANLQVLGYTDDLNWYYRSGPGKVEYRRLFSNLVCFNMQDLVQFLFSDDPNDHKARLYNGHLIPMSMILTNLGAFLTDEPLTRHNMAQQMERVWTAGTNIPLASNLAVIRYDCAGGDNDILFLQNEVPLQIPGCSADGVCKQSLMRQRLGHWLDADCMEIFCTNS